MGREEFSFVLMVDERSSWKKVSPYISKHSHLPISIQSILVAINEPIFYELINSVYIPFGEVLLILRHFVENIYWQHGREATL
jgi:hypothetical protein